MNFFNKLSYSITGNPDKVSLEHRIFNLVCFIAILIALGSIAQNIVFKFNIIHIVITSISAVISLFFYLLSRIKKIYLFWIFIFFILTIFSISWFYNNGPLGSVNYLYIMSLIVLISFLQQKHHFIIVCLIISNIAVLHIIYYYYPDSVKAYPSEDAQYIKLTITLTYVILFTSLVFSIIKGNFEHERIKAENQSLEMRSQTQGIKEGVKYASVIQQAIFNQERTLKKIFYNYFILWKPRDDVSGDFYWVKSLDNKVVIAIGDCTGHGVSAAFLSVMGLSFLNEIVKPYLTPGEILNRLRRKMKKALNQTTGDNIWETKDGMDISLCMIDLNKYELEYSGAFLSLYILRQIEPDKPEIELIELKGDKQPIGVFVAEKDFNTYITKLATHDSIYMFSDGYYDQFGGKKNSKYLSKNFKNLLINLQSEQIKFNEQRDYLDNQFATWKGKNEQIDDVLILGFKISK